MHTISISLANLISNARDKPASGCRFLSHTFVMHGDDMTWKRFPYYGTYMRDIQQSPVYSSRKRPAMLIFGGFFLDSLDKP